MTEYNMTARDVYEVLNNVDNHEPTLKLESEKIQYLASKQLIVDMDADVYASTAQKIQNYIAAASSLRTVSGSVFALQRDINDLESKLNSKLYRAFTRNAVLDAKQEQLNQLESKYSLKNSEEKELESKLENMKEEKQLASDFNNGRSLESYVRGGNSYIKLTAKATAALPFLTNFVASMGAQSYDVFDQNIPEMEKASELKRRRRLSKSYFTSMPATHDTYNNMDLMTGLLILASLDNSYDYGSVDASNPDVFSGFDGGEFGGAGAGGVWDTLSDNSPSDNNFGSDSTNFDSGNYDSGNYDSGSYDSGSYDSGSSDFGGGGGDF